MKVKTCWLTLNRACNLRCEWCYAKEANFKVRDDMPLEKATNIIDMCVANGVKHFILIGGEPTIHPNFFDVLKYIVQLGYKATVVTNGLRFSNEIFCEEISEYIKNIRVSISLKGSNNLYYKKHCGAAAFDSVLQGIRNCKKYKIIYSLTYVLSADNVQTLDLFTKEIREQGLDDFIAFSFCNEVMQPTGEFKKAYDQIHPLMVNKIFCEKYESINDILDGKFSLHQTLPLCMCDIKFVDIMKQRKQIATSCHVHNREGIIFDTNGSVLLCNHFVGYGVGNYGEDYKDANSLSEFWNSEKMISLHKMLTSMPSKKCQVCDWQSNCGGGCCIQWFSQDFEQYQHVFNNIIRNQG